MLWSYIIKENTECFSVRWLSFAEGITKSRRCWRWTYATRRRHSSNSISLSIFCHLCTMMCWCVVWSFHKAILRGFLGWINWNKILNWAIWSGYRPIYPSNDWKQYFSIFFYYSESNVLSLVTLTVLTYRIGEVFIHLSPEETQDFLETAKSKLQEEIKTLDSQSGEVKSILGNLKVKLYAKFGNNINLEAEEEWKNTII